MSNIKIFDVACLISEVEFLSPLSAKTLLMIAQELAETKQAQVKDKLKSILNMHSDERFAEEIEELSQQLSSVIK